MLFVDPTLKLMVAILDDSAEGVRSCLAKYHSRRKSIVDVPASDGLTPLVAACRHASVDIVRLLVDHGADVNLADGTGMIPIVASCMRNNLDGALFLAGNSSVDFGRVPNPTFLMGTAIAGGRVDLLGALLDRGLDPSVSTEGMLTPLMAAARGANLTAFELLLERGADPDAMVKDENGHLIGVREIIARSRAATEDEAMKAVYTQVEVLLTQWKGRHGSRAGGA